MPDSDYVLIESADGYSFVVSRKIACASGMLKTMLDEDGERLLYSGPSQHSSTLAAHFKESENATCKIQYR